MNIDSIEFQILYQLIGILAVIVSFISYQFKENKMFLWFQSLSCALFSVQFALGEFWVPAMMNALCILRSVFYAISKNKKLDFALAIIFSLLFITIAVINICYLSQSIFFSIICCLASIVSTVTLSIKKNLVIRIAQLSFVSPVWLANGIYTCSIGGIIAESMNIISVIIALIKNKK